MPGDAGGAAPQWDPRAQGDPHPTSTALLPSLKSFAEEIL